MMGKLIVSDYVTVDGVMEAPQDWVGPFWVPEVDEESLELVNSVDALLFGRVTYGDFAAAWPERDDPLAERINGMQKYVASNTIEDPGWKNVEVLRDSVPDRVKAMKKSGRDLLIYGSGRLVRSLIDAGLVDEFRLLVAPIVIGTGAHVFEPGGPRVTLRLTGSKQFASGLLANAYVRA
jgi:dihydrofolate reductase